RSRLRIAPTITIRTVMRFTAALLIAFTLPLLSASQAAATTVTVDAFINSTGGTGVPAVTGLVLTPGDRLTVSVAPDDCVSAGEDDRTTNANGLVGHTTNPCRPSAPNVYGPLTQFGETFP